MDLLQLLILLAIAGICGAIAQWVVAFSPGSLLVSIIVGVVGAYLGTLIASLLGIPQLAQITIGGKGFDLLWAVVGSIILLLLLKVLRDSAVPWVVARRGAVRRP